MTQNPAATPLLACRGVEKRFGPVIANKDINLEVFPGEILAILGENGAGKSTLMSIIAGRYRPDAGSIEINGKASLFVSPAKALSLGVGMVYQRFMLMDTLTVAENILLAADACGRSVSLRAIKKEINLLANRYGLEIDADRQAGSLSMGERQRAEILKLLVQSARLLIFDEPTAVLAPPDVERFFQVVSRLKEDGCGIIFITHKLEEVLKIADRIAILRKGRIITQTTLDRVSSKRDLARLMVGREVVLRVDKPTIATKDTVLEVCGLTGPKGSMQPAFTDISFNVCRGEILSIIGVAGNGQASLCKTINAQTTGQNGTIQFLGNSFDAATWATRRQSEIAYVPEDRHHAGSVAGMDLAENFLLTRLEQSGNSFWLQHARMESDIQTAVQEYSIVTHSSRTLAGQLSGGNLQKLILARELAKNPALFIAEQPTQGLDISATEEVWQAILAQRQFSAVLLFTGDLKEALSLSDRIAVMFSGRIIEIINAGDADSVGRIGLLMAGAGG
ncbi:ABC transporter ATP-binding protein [Desulforhopalus sp. IMCC35007]|uniref:ABC transporter ATP-binding protein n=1 Tax=Desulforhopalus sp. IMCC35007 TaxID=2569543 RepID=UPI0010AE59CA|nr:ABC transporter ATP-binding protein [Desulforhopalus sp. IMCC35007]TKB08557.1 ABC transporter ATP-binding protein [Desulforhopalus sp. IMCC35007]